MEYEEIAELLQSYGADPDVLFEYHCLPLRVRVVRSVLKLRTPVGTWALKKVYMNESKLLRVYQVSEHVARAGLLSVPRFIKSRYGDPFIVHPSGLYYMTAWIPGREVDLRKDAHLFASSKLLAAWHRAAEGFHADGDWSMEGIGMRERLQNGKSALTLVLDRARTTPHPSSFERLVLAAADELHERIADSESQFHDVDLASLEQTAKQRGLICHGNFTKKNILFDGDTYTLVNYDSVHPGPPIYDFILFIHRYLPAYDWDQEILQNAVYTYETESGLSASDRTRLRALVGAPFRPLQIISWYLSRGVEWTEEDFVDALELALELEEPHVAAVANLRSNQLELPVGADSGPKIEWAGGNVSESGQVQLLADAPSETRLDVAIATEPKTQRRRQRRRRRPSQVASHQTAQPRRDGPTILTNAVYQDVSSGENGENIDGV